jgi:signal transduction histidine kinase
VNARTGMRRFQSVRVRATVGATVIVAVALVVAAIALVGVLRQSQVEILDDNLELRATDIESLIDGGAELSTVTVQSDEGGLVQILDEQGQVIASSENIDGEAPIADQTPNSLRTIGISSLDGESFRVGSFATDGERRLTIIVGIDTENVERTASAAVSALLVGVPLLLGLIALLVWIVVGRALHPVEQMRREVDDIGGSDLHRRLREPVVRDEIGKLAVTMNEMLDRLEESSEAQARFVSDASHELRTPIAVIRHELEIALRDDDADLLRQTASDVLDEDLRMQHLVDDLLLLARRPGVPADPVDAPLVDLDDVAMVEAHRVPHELHVDTSAVSAGQVRGQPERLARIVRNLLDNALRHATANVAVTVTSLDGRVVLHVDDDGPGVPPAERERIFERFGRADESRTRGDGGTGLGLAIVRQLAQALGGAVSIETSPTLGGARFTVTFPDARS